MVLMEVSSLWQDRPSWALARIADPIGIPTRPVTSHKPSKSAVPGMRITTWLPSRLYSLINNACNYTLESGLLYSPYCSIDVSFM